MPLQGTVKVGPLLAALGIEAVERGGEWRAKCPNHSPDRHPSWAIIDEPGHERHGLHRCMTCSFGGTSAHLVMHVRGYASWSSAYEFMRPYLSTETALPVRVRLAGVEQRLPFRPPPEVIWDPLDRWVTAARRYALSRGITSAQVLQWGIGYAVDGWLAGRIVFPLRDRQDRLLNYQARLFAGDGPTYLTPREEDRPDKGAVFGERHWPPPGASRRRVVVWEGSIKALAFERALPGEYFAVLGGVQAWNAEHVAKLSTWREVVLATDKDRAGEGAAELLTGALQRHVKVSRAILPRDPDEMSPGQVAEYFR